MELIRIRDKIFDLRGHHVILDFDVAGLFDLNTRQVKDTVSRHAERFPEDFSFGLTREEWMPLRRQFLNTKIRQRPFPTQPPIAFTDRGVAMLAATLPSVRAAEMHVAIARAYVALQQAAASHGDLMTKIEGLEKQHAVKYDDLHQALLLLIAPVQRASAFIGIRRK